MIKGPTFVKSLDVLLLFGEDPVRFEQDLIHGFYDEFVFGDSYNFYTEEVKVLVREYQDDETYTDKIEITSYPKIDLIKYAIDVETYRALGILQGNYYKIQNYCKHKWIFARITNCFLTACKISIVDYPYRDYFLNCFAEIVQESISLYGGIFSDLPNLRDVKNKLQSLPKGNITGYKLKTPFCHTKINPFTNRLITKGYIDLDDRDKFKQFLFGEIPVEKIEWKKEPRHLVYFIKKLNEKRNKNPQYLESPPGQKWKYLYLIFSHSQSNLPEKFYEKFSKLGKKYQKHIDLLFEIFNS
jgi:hypothetical protein